VEAGRGIMAGEISSMLVSVLLMGIVLFALSSAFLSVANEYSVPVSQNLTQSLTNMNQSQSDLMDWANSSKGSLPDTGDNQALLSWITGGIFSVLTSPIALIGVFINLINAFADSLSLAFGVEMGIVSFIINSLVAILTITFIFAIIRSLTGKTA
jgi:hypothetical protein